MHVCMMHAYHIHYKSSIVDCIVRTSCMSPPYDDTGSWTLAGENINANQDQASYDGLWWAKGTMDL